MKLEFSRQILKNIEISNFIKIRPVGAELFHADGQTGMTKLEAAFRNFRIRLMKRRKAHWIGDFLPRKCLLKHFSEGKIEGTGRRGIKCKQLLMTLTKREDTGS